MSLLSIEGYPISPNCLAALEKCFAEKGASAAYEYSKELGQQYTPTEFYEVLGRDKNTGAKKEYQASDLTYQTAGYLHGVLDVAGDEAALAKAKEFGFRFADAAALKAALGL
jgi:hypothetical protein